MDEAELMDFPEEMLIILEIVVAKILQFPQLSFVDQLNKSVPDDMGGHSIRGTDREW